jgi:uncharacterized membrane protein (DUF2068 family)
LNLHENITRDCNSSRSPETKGSVIIRKPLLTAVRAIAIFEAAKGGLVLLVGLGILSLIHKDVEAFAERLVRVSHLNPASHYPQIFVEAASRVTDTHLWLLATAAALYALVRGVEAYGLWKERRWAEWFALVAGGIYVPVEIYEIFHRLSWLKVAVLTTNLAIVAYMAYMLRHPLEQARERAK